ncbi:flagellar hook-length control protein FliK [Clostridium acetireducens DSM 10703]|uniref:Flagellar hook-length control protein FliK n=1 Tax=Clostridium acetireducens DSM 10703 TaxID=1121290 RepID=A0A1E8F078_9CLOT|nr:flagellar hook-length control protein FliK [Clostridium acetireducens]OFI06809.1 flagellar hook-length control protein FliK [Clostridium acetireducens DSM 10703]
MEISLMDLSKNNFSKKNIKSYKNTNKTNNDFSKYLKETKNKNQCKSLDCKNISGINKEKEINNVDDKTKLNNIKSELKNVGINSKEIENANSLEDIKEAVTEVLKDNKILGKLNNEDCESSLINLLILLLLQGNLTKEDLKNIMPNENAENTIDKIKISIVEKVLLNNLPLDGDKNITKQDVFKSLPNIIKDLTETLNNNEKVDIKDNKFLNIVSKIQQKIENIFGENNTLKGTDNLLDKIKNEISLLIDESKLGNLVNHNKSNSISTNNSILQNEEYMNTSKISIENLENSNNEENNLLNNSQNNSEEDFLENLVSSKGEDKISKVTNFMNQFNNVNVDNLSKVEENIVINKSNFNNDIIKAVKFMQLNDLKELSVKVMPKELGELVISLTVEKGVMKANISAANKEAYNILNSNLEEITSKIQENNIKIHNFTIDIYNQDTTFFKDGSKNRNENGNFKQQHNNVQTIESEDENQENKVDSESNLNILA